jgi:hypothetical protein
MTDRFAAQIADWAQKAELAQTDVLHLSIRLLVEEVTRPESAGGHLPVVTGNLRNSIAVSTTGPVTFNFTTKKFRDPSDTVNNAIAGIEIGKTAYVGFRAPYAHKREADHAFMRLAAQRWPQIANQAAKIRSGR